MQCANFFESFSDRFEAVNQILGQMFAFAFSHFDQLGKALAAHVRLPAKLLRRLTIAPGTASRRALAKWC